MKTRTVNYIATLIASQVTARCTATLKIIITTSITKKNLTAVTEPYRTASICPAVCLMRRLLLPRSATATTSAISITTHSHTTVTTRMATTFMRKSSSVVQKNGTILSLQSSTTSSLPSTTLTVTTSGTMKMMRSGKPSAKLCAMTTIAPCTVITALTNTSKSTTAAGTTANMTTKLATPYLVTSSMKPWLVWTSTSPTVTIVATFPITTVPWKCASTVSALARTWVNLITSQNGIQSCLEIGTS